MNIFYNFFRPPLAKIVLDFDKGKLIHFSSFFQLIIKEDFPPWRRLQKSFEIFF